MSKKIIIIGGGLSGSLLLLNLLAEEITEEIEITVIEKEHELGLGAAYSTKEKFHLLNVSADRMGWSPFKIDDFYNWLILSKIPVTQTGFASRMLFGQYIQYTLEYAISLKRDGITIKNVFDEAIDVSTCMDGSFEVKTKNGKTINGDKLILAIGNPPPSDPKSFDYSYVKSKFYKSNPWNEDVVSDLLNDKSNQVVIVGTGLTMVDSLMSLNKAKYKGKILAISTHGYIPMVHLQSVPYKDFYEEIIGSNSLLTVFKTIRKHLNNAENIGYDWRAIVDSIRPHTQQIWLDLPIEEKKRFMRHLRHKWGVARHRMPNECANIIIEMLRSGQLKIKSGRIKNIELYNGDFEGENLSITYFDKTREDKEDETLICGMIINCTGPESDYSKVNSILIKNLLDKKMICKDQMNLGLDCLPTGEIKDGSGKVVKNFYTMGPTTKGILWESIAVPEIRKQAFELGAKLLK